MTKVNTTITAVPYQIPSLEGQRACENLMRDVKIWLSQTSKSMDGVLGWVLRGCEHDTAVNVLRASNPTQHNSLIEIHRPHHRPIPPHISSIENPSSLYNIHSSPHPSSLVTLQGGYLAQQSGFKNSAFRGDSLHSDLSVFSLCPSWLKHVLLISYFLFHLSYLATAQTAYTGGSGDGHAMEELQLRQVTINELTVKEGYYIYPSLAKAGENIYITSPVTGVFTLVDVTGRIIHTETFETPAQQFAIPVTQPGLCIGILRTAQGTFTQKIVVVE